MKSSLTILFLLSVAAGETHGQRAVAQTQSDRPDLRDGVLVRIESRTGFLITKGEGFTDRPFVQLDGGVQLGRASVGGPPAVAFTLGAAVGAGEFLGEAASISMRVLGGVELPWAVGTSLGANPVEIVPSIQAGYQRSYGQDERRGFTLRATVGLRLLLAASAVYFTFEPVSFVHLASPDATNNPNASQLAAELGFLKVGWRF